MSYVLRPYQVDAVEAGVRFFLDKAARYNALMMLPTGSGKSLCIAGIAQRLDGPVLVFQPSKEILDQNLAKYQSYGNRAAVYSASFNSRDIGHVTFATIGSVKNKADLFRAFRYVIIDEAHGVNAKNEDGMYTRFLRELGDVKCLGLTASPYRLVTDGFGGSILKFLTRTRPRVFKELIYYVQNGDLFRDGYLAKLKYTDASAGFDRGQLRINSTGADYDDDSVARYYAKSGFMDRVAAATRRAMTERKNVLIFTRFVEDGERLMKMVHGVEMVTAESTKREREAVVGHFRLGITKAVVNCAVLCLDGETEILTRQGWCGIDEMDYSRDIACWSMDGTIRFAPPKKIIRRQRIAGERMVSAHGSAINFRVTENHRMVRSYGRDLRWTTTEARQLVGRRFAFPSSGIADPCGIQIPNEHLSEKEIRRKVICNSYNYRKNGEGAASARRIAVDLVMRRAGLRYTQPKDLSLDDCRFIGFWLGDGSISRWQCSIVQSKIYKNIIEWFEGVIKRTGFHCNRGIIKKRANMSADAVRWYFARGTGGRGQVVQNGYYRLEPYLKKRGSELFWGLSRDQFSALMEGLWYADGEHGIGNKYADSSSSRWSIIGMQKQLYDLLQAVGACRGFRFTQRKVKKHNPKHSQLWDVRWQEIWRTFIAWGKPILENHWKDERVWCVESETSYIITRRNGLITIMGNCTGFDYPELETVILARPTMSLALWYQMIGRCIRPHPEKEYAEVIDLCGNCAMFGRVEDLELVDGGHGMWHIESNGTQLTNIYYGNRGNAGAWRGGAPTSVMSGTIEHETEKAYLLRHADGRELWWPKSKLVVMRIDGLTITARIPKWLAVDKGMT